MDLKRVIEFSGKSPLRVKRRASLSAGQPHLFFRANQRPSGYTATARKHQ